LLIPDRCSPNRAAHQRYFGMGGHHPGVEISAEAQARTRLEFRSKQTVCPYGGAAGAEQAFADPGSRGGG
jgi:hypothetical protein